jgi:hypothetical protein
MDISANASDTDELPKLPDNGIVFIKGQQFTSERFSLQVRRNRVVVNESSMKGSCDYFRHVFRLENPSRVLFTYRKSGYGDIVHGMAVCVVEMSGGQILFDDYIL